MLRCLLRFEVLPFEATFLVFFLAFAIRPSVYAKETAHGSN
jgi:hypothetical protein